MLLDDVFRHQRQARWPALRPPMDVPTGCQADPRAAYRMEISLHGIRDHERTALNPSIETHKAMKPLLNRPIVLKMLLRGPLDC